MVEIMNPTQTHPLITSLHSSFQQNQSVVLATPHSCRSMGRMESLWHYRDASFHTERYPELSDTVSSILRDSKMYDNHSWIRLKTPTGEIYNIGLFRPEIVTLDEAITESDFSKLKAFIEEDKRNKSLVFKLCNNNCLLYCKTKFNFNHPTTFSKKYT